MIDIRDVTYDDKDGLDVLYGNAFPDEELRPAVKALSFDTPNVISLVALVDGVVSGHVAFTLCAVENGTGDVALLAPLAVAPARQRKGLGSMLVREGFQRLRMSNVLRCACLVIRATTGVLDSGPKHGSHRLTRCRKNGLMHGSPSIWMTALQRQAVNSSYRRLGAIRHTGAHRLSTRSTRDGGRSR